MSFASATGSILTIVAAYLLGVAILSRTAGIVLSVIVAIEYDLISWSVDGWRDDVFMAAVTFSAWAFVRCQRDPSRKNAVFLGVATAAACLTRITALSFARAGVRVAHGRWRQPEPHSASAYDDRSRAHLRHHRRAVPRQLRDRDRRSALRHQLSHALLPCGRRPALKSQ